MLSSPFSIELQLFILIFGQVFFGIILFYCYFIALQNVSQQASVGFLSSTLLNWDYERPKGAVLLYSSGVAALHHYPIVFLMIPLKSHHSARLLFKLNSEESKE